MFSSNASLLGLFQSLNVHEARSSSLVSKILSNADIHDSVFTHCSPATLYRISWTCRTANEAAKSFIKRAYNINIHLTRYFPDPVAFRSLQARTGTLISGSTALQFLDRTSYPESDLDIYVPAKESPEVGEWLIDAGYSFEPNASQPDEFEVAMLQMQTTQRRAQPLALNRYSRMRGVSGVFNFLKAVAEGSNGSPLKIQLIAASRSPAEAILNFHSTCVMNIVSYSTAYSLYPRATFETREALVWRSLDRPPLEKYTARGWKMIVTRPERVSDPSLIPGSRWIDDHLSWVLPLSLDGVVPVGARNFPPDPIAHTNWQLDYRVSSTGGLENYALYRETPVMRYSLVHSSFLRHIYALTDELLILALNGALEGVHVGWEKTHKFLRRGGYLSGINADLPKHDGLLRSECDTYRETIRRKRLPLVLSNDPPEVDPLIEI